MFTLWFIVSLGLGQRYRTLAAGQASAQASPAALATSLDWSVGSGWLEALVWGLVALFASDLIQQALSSTGLEIPSILVLTSVALLMAQLPGAQKRRSCYGLGLVLIQPFFVVIGFGTPLAGVLAEGRWILVYAALVVAAHAVAVLPLHRFNRLPLPELLVASQAAIGGPSTALALATGLDRDDLAVAGVALGLLGYVIGTYLGVAVAAWVV